MGQRPGEKGPLCQEFGLEVHGGMKFRRDDGVPVLKTFTLDQCF